jgi:transcriptional regulator GlxA family with amidase domain
MERSPACVDCLSIATPTSAALALEVARVLVVFLRRPGNQAQFSVSLETQSVERKPLHELRVWMAEHLTTDLSVPALARRVAMSSRNFQRVFTSEAGKSPARYVEELRIETAAPLGTHDAKHG